jgi:hypothetical protein
MDLEKGPNWAINRTNNNNNKLFFYGRGLRISIIIRARPFIFRVNASVLVS